MKTGKYFPPLAIIFAAILWSFDGFFRQNIPVEPFYSFSILISFSVLIIVLEHTLGGILFLPVLIRGWHQLKALHEQSWTSVIWVSIFGGVLGTVAYTAALFHINYIELSVVVLLQK